MTKYRSDPWGTTKIDHSETALELLTQYEQTKDIDRDPDLLTKALIHATLEAAQATWESS